MTIKLELTFSSFAELSAFTAQHGGGSATKAPAETAKTQAAKPVAKVEKAPVPETASEELDDTGVEETSQEVVNFDAVKDAILNLNKVKGKAAAVGVLAKFGAEKVGPQLKEKDYGAVIAECKKALAA